MSKTAEEWLAERRAASSMKISDASLGNSTPWGMQTDEAGNEYYGRTDGKFFVLEAVNVGESNREVQGWNQPLLRETLMPGVVVVATNPEKDRFILSAREEPGNSPEKNYTLLAAPFQASKSNLDKVHDGGPPPRLEWYENANLFDQSQDGGRYRDKYNQIGFVIIEDFDSIELADNERIYTLDELRDAMYAGDCNSHLVEVMAFVLI